MKLAILLAALTLAGCATTADVDMARAHYEAQAAANERPIMHLKARQGEDMVLVGVDELTVYGGRAEVSAYRQQHHPAWMIVGNVLQTVLPIVYGGKVIVDVADIVGSRVSEVAQNPTVVEQPAPVQQPAPVIVDQPAPIVVEQPAPIFAPDPVIVQPQPPIVIPPPDPIFGPEPIIVQPQPIFVPGAL